MERKYIFKRTMFVAVQSVLLILYIALAAFVLQYEIAVRTVVLLSIVFGITITLLGRGIKGMPFIVKDNGFEMFSQFVGIRKIDSIDIGENEIVIVVKKGTFLLGNKLKMRKQKMKNPQMWELLVEDMKSLQEKVIL